MVVDLLPDLYHLLDVVCGHWLLIRLYCRVRVRLGVGVIDEYLSLHSAS